MQLGAVAPSELAEHAERRGAVRVGLRPQLPRERRHEVAHVRPHPRLEEVRVQVVDLLAGQKKKKVWRDSVHSL